MKKVKLVEDDYPLVTSRKKGVKRGNRVEIVFMDDPNPVPPGTRGTVTDVSLTYSAIDVVWDNGSSLSILTDKDKFKIIRRVK